jgi:hypothetical protein
VPASTFKNVPLCNSKLRRINHYRCTFKYCTTLTDGEQDAPPTFHPFPRLPKELRLQIWKHALPEPRTLDPILTDELGLDPDKGPWRPKYNKKAGILCNWTAKTLPNKPPLPEIWYEAWENFTQFYQRTSIYDQAVGSLGQAIWVNCSRGAFYLNKKSYYNLIS